MDEKIKCNGLSFSPPIRCPFCSKSNEINLEKKVGFEKKICPSCNRMFLIYKKKVFHLFYFFDTKII
jgi:hypothetical protein